MKYSEKYHIQFILSSKEKKNQIIKQVFLSGKKHLMTNIQPRQKPEEEWNIPHRIFLEYGKRTVYDTLG